jgi:hypothetical protein
MWVRSLTTDWSTAQLTALGSVLRLPLPTVPKVAVLTERPEQSGETSLKYQTDAKARFHGTLTMVDSQRDTSKGVE